MSFCYIRVFVFVFQPMQTPRPSSACLARPVTAGKLDSSSSAAKLVSRYTLSRMLIRSIIVLSRRRVETEPGAGEPRHAGQGYQPVQRPPAERDHGRVQRDVTCESSM